MKEVFGLGNDLPSLAIAFGFDPGFIYFDYLLEPISYKELVLKITYCLPQAQRIQSGRGAFDCRKVEELYFGGFSSTINSEIRAKCEFRSPEKPTDNIWCL